MGRIKLECNPRPLETEDIHISHLEIHFGHFLHHRSAGKGPLSAPPSFLCSRACIILLRGPVFFQRRDPFSPPLQPHVFENIASRKTSSDWSTIYRDKNGGQ